MRLKIKFFTYRISAAKVLGLEYINADVSVMVPKEVEINKQWEEYSYKDQNKLNQLSNKYKKMLQEFNNIQDKAFETNNFTEYDKFNKKLNNHVEKINRIEEKLLKEEKEFKQNLLNKYLN